MTNKEGNKSHDFMAQIHGLTKNLSFFQIFVYWVNINFLIKRSRWPADGNKFYFLVQPGYVDLSLICGFPFAWIKKILLLTCMLIEGHFSYIVTSKLYGSWKSWSD